MFSVFWVSNSSLIISNMWVSVLFSQWFTTTSWERTMYFWHFFVVVNYTVLPCEKNITPLSFAIRIDNRMSHMITLQASLPLLRPFRLSLRQPHSSRPLENLLVKTRLLLPSFRRHLWSIWVVRITSYSYSFICLLCLFLWNKEVDGAEHYPPPPIPSPPFFFELFLA